jgi:hypothetical protein
MTGLRYLNTGLAQYKAQVLIVTFNYAVSTAEVRIKCIRELKLFVGKYLEIGRPTLLLLVEQEELREIKRIAISIF